jgi:hypothetical protein
MRPGLDEVVTVLVTPAAARAALDEWLEAWVVVEVVTRAFQADYQRQIVEDHLTGEDYDEVLLLLLTEAAQYAAVLLNVPVRVRMPSPERMAFETLPEFEINPEGRCVHD